MDEPTATVTSVYTVNGMTCAHCVAAVTAEVRKIDGVTDVEVDLSAGEVTVHAHGPIDPDAFAAAVDEAGYEVAG